MKKLITYDINSLIDQSKNGDAKAFSALYEKYSIELYRFALYMVGSKEDAEDAVQEAVISAWQGIGALKDNEAFKPWLFKILGNKCKTLLMKKNKYADELPVDDYSFFIDAPVDESLINNAELKEALASLTPPDGQIILLSVIGGFKSFELASIFNMTPGAVRTRQKRALEKLREIL